MSDTRKDFMLTTFDNPFNPFTDFELWWKQDLILGHDCCGTLARYANVVPFYSDEVNDLSIEEAVDEIVHDEPTIYRKVFRDDYRTA